VVSTQFIHCKFEKYWREAEPCPRFMKEPEQLSRSQEKDLSQLDAIRLCIPELKSVGHHEVLEASSLDPESLDSLGSLICFQTQNGPIVDFREATLSTRQLHSLLLPEIPELHTSTCHEYVRKRNFQENLAVLKSNLWRSVEEVDLQQVYGSRPDDDEHDALSQIERLESVASELIGLISEGDLTRQFANLLHLAGTLQNLKCALSSAGVGGLTDSDCDIPSGLPQMTDDCFQALISRHRALQARMQEWREAHPAEYDAYAKCRAEREECSSVTWIWHEPRLQAAAVDERPDLKEDLLDFATQREAFCAHVRSFVGESDRVYLVVFSSQQARQVCPPPPSENDSNEDVEELNRPQNDPNEKRW